MSPTSNGPTTPVPTPAPPCGPLPAPDHRHRWTITGAVVGVAAAVLIGWWTLRNESARITATTVSYQVLDNASVAVTFDVTRPPGQPVTCTVQAIDGHFTVVGTADIVIPPQGERTVHQQLTVRTTNRAVTGVVQDCVRT
ncbi:DUF4307 domain-containing protein [Lapillicoccus sp.]|uniref:DUF4307 domain-containing protein n=1 Tax=Lapillicoccus sp. TaxID=1909287 RepID=UPI0027CE2319|nr:DUF4307 domain-containing protein [Actinomycetota bacterium]